MRNTVDIMGIPVDYITMTEAVGKLEEFIKEDRCHAIYTPNAEMLMAGIRDPELKNVLSQADMLIADGAGVVLASKILKRDLPEKVSGIDLVNISFNFFDKKGVSYFLLGAKSGVAQIAAMNILHDHPGIKIAGYHDGYFTEQEEAGIIEQINTSGADILLVALSVPKQEFWIHKNKDKLKAKVCIGCGGTIDVIAGKAELAPDFFRRNGLEWLFRLYKEPRRIKRMLDLPRFMARVVAARLSGK